MYCEFEASDCADDEFEFTADNGWVHKVNPRHTTLGYIIDESGGYEQDAANDFEGAEE